MNKLETLLEEIRELSDVNDLSGSADMQENLEQIHEMVSEFLEEMFDLDNHEDE